MFCNLGRVPTVAEGNLVEVGDASGPATTCGAPKVSPSMRMKPLRQLPPAGGSPRDGSGFFFSVKNSSHLGYFRRQRFAHLEHSKSSPNQSGKSKVLHMAQFATITCLEMSTSLLNVQPK